MRKTALLCVLSYVLVLGCSNSGERIELDELGITSPSGLDIQHLKQDVDLDPVTGRTSGSVVISAKSIREKTDTLYVLLDQGLSARRVSSPGRLASLHQEIVSGKRVVTITLWPAIPPETGAEISIQYGGTLKCARVGAKSACDLASTERAGRFETGSAFAWVTSGSKLDLMTQEVTLRTPSGMTALASAIPVSETESGAKHVTVWSVSNPVLNSLDVYVGALESAQVASGETNVRFFHRANDGAWTDHLKEWVPRIVTYLQQKVHRELPYSNVSLFKLSDAHGEFGHSGIAHVCLSSWHGSGPDAMSEEVWAHELSHFFWGVSIVPADFDRERALTEGLAVLTALDYAYRRLHSGEDRDRYVAWRLREAELLLQYLAPKARDLPLVSSSLTELPAGIEWWSWAYAKAPAALDYLRVVVGDDVFDRALSAYARKCQYASCAMNDFVNVLESISGAKLGGVFRALFLRGALGSLKLSFRQASPNVLEVTATRSTGERLPVELWVEDVNGVRTRHVVTLSGDRETFRLASTSLVRSVRPNPRQDVLLSSRSASLGDVNFDLTVNADDLQICMAKLGKRVSAPFVIGASLTGVDLDFEPRCDFDADGSITPGDIKVIQDAMASADPH